MLFNSIEFLVFFPIVTLSFFCVPHRYRTLHLLLASCLFYMAFVPQYLLILLIAVLIDYLAGIWIEDTADQRGKNLCLFASIVCTCSILFVFKYLDFVSLSVQTLATLFGIQYTAQILNIVLPIGLSFHIFQSLSYVIEVYRGRQKAERDFLVYSLYVMFYPQLVAGPIERPQNLLYQFHQQIGFDTGRIASGLRLMAWGLFKKVVIADRLSPLVDHVYSQPKGHEGLPLIIATVFFAIQIYCDFSGYSEIAIGAARVMGFRLMSNFDRPYESQSVAEFWRRWHISLSTWFKDYVYIPLGGSRSSSWQTAFNVMVTFLLSGLWHGANWTFLFWGALNGAFVVGELFWSRAAGSLFGQLPDHPLLSFLRTIRTFLLICVTWVFFRCKTVADGFYIIRHSFDGLERTAVTGLWEVLANFSSQTIFGFHLGVTRGSFWFSMALILFLLVAERRVDPESARVICAGRVWWQRWPTYFALVYSTLFLGVFQTKQFIYFQF